MIQRRTNHAEAPQPVGRPPSLKLWVPVALAASLIVGTLMFLVLPRLWDVLFPVELKHRTGTLRLLEDLDGALRDITRSNPETSLESFLVPDQVNAGAKAVYRCLHSAGNPDEDALRQAGWIATDRDGEPMFVDAWKNPVVFIPASGAGRSFTCRNAAGTVYTVRAPDDFAGRRWLLWSVGPDGVNQSGGGDDLQLPRDNTAAGP
ncbi:MAG TPA: hypothetical protein VMX12_05605 [Acidimicrobiia bacterium]|nr:hypothetical protein [Acidimicrobiia bacterium]